MLDDEKEEYDTAKKAGKKGRKVVNLTSDTEDEDMNESEEEEDKLPVLRSKDRKPSTPKRRGPGGDDGGVGAGAAITPSQKMLIDTFNSFLAA